jgi:hypothetical protein
MDGDLIYFHVVRIPAIPAGMTGLNTLVYNDENAGGRQNNMDEQDRQDFS